MVAPAVGAAVERSVEVVVALVVAVTAASVAGVEQRLDGLVATMDVAVPVVLLELAERTAAAASAEPVAPPASFLVSPH